MGVSLIPVNNFTVFFPSSKCEASNLRKISQLNILMYSKLTAVRKYWWYLPGNGKIYLEGRQSILANAEYSLS